jgi:hypothetical protein
MKLVTPIAAVSTSETSVNFYETTLCNNPEDSHLHISHYENLKSYYVGRVYGYLGSYTSCKHMWTDLQNR